jgi:hypothetical protein
MAEPFATAIKDDSSAFKGVEAYESTTLQSLFDDLIALGQKRQSERARRIRIFDAAAAQGIS